MSKSGLRVRLFLFVDCLLALRSKLKIVRSLQKYSGDESVELPVALKSILNFANPDFMP
ncbi:hypothetical protein [Crinalium epipsammum]|uniref:hypothetical protein n=1 Tax=Crinalium epipsammum TaxID=241425 RepID=UPI0002FF8B86|nr:hypothetical protein [Crinalium epipsammum]